MKTLVRDARSNETEQQSAALRSAALPRDLVELVRRHRVRFAVYPECVALSGAESKAGAGPAGHAAARLRKVGFAIELTGIHFEPRHAPSPGCGDCHRVYQALRRIARFAIPEDERPTMHTLEPFRPVLGFRPQRGAAPEVTLTIRVVHRCDYRGSVDACELRCLEEISARLRALGAVRDGA